MAGEKFEVAQVGISVMKEREIGDVAITKEPNSEFGIADGTCTLPAEHALPATCDKDREWLADIAENCGGRTQATVGRLRGSNSVASRLLVCQSDLGIDR